MSMEPGSSPSSPARRVRLVGEALGIACLALTLNLAGNGRVGLWDRDEPRYATCTREMRERGDWLRPTFNGEPRYHKPVLIYWLMRGGTALGGDNPFGARLVSAFAGLGTCLLAWRLGRSIAGPTAGLIAGLALASVPIMVAESKLATTDATLALLVASAQACLWVLTRRDSARAAFGFWLALALAALLKGPVGPVLIAASGVIWWWWGGWPACWARLRWRVGLVLFLGLTLPCYLAVGVASRGEFFRFAIRTQIVQRVTSGMEQHGGFPGYYPVLALPTFYPWSVLAIPALAWAWKRRREAPEFGFLLGWIVGPWLVLECFGTKLIHYYLPAFPGCAVLVACFVAEVARSGGGLRSWPLGRLAVRLLGSIGLGAAGFLGVAGFLVPRGLLGPCLAIGVVLGIGTAWSRVRLAEARTLAAVRGLLATWMLVMGVFVAWLLPSAEPIRLSRRAGERLGALAERSGIRPAMMIYQEPGLVYAVGHPILDVHGYDEMALEVAESGPVLVPLLPTDLDAMRGDPRFSLRSVDSIRGYNVNKGKFQTLEFVIVAPPGSAEIATGGEDPLVK